MLRAATERPGRAATAGWPSAAFPPALAVVAVWLAWSWLDGGFGATVWGPLGIVLVAVAALSAAQLVPAAEGLRLRLVAVAALGAFTLWNFLSIAWAGSRDDAWTGSEKTLAYALGFCALALWALTRRERVVLLALYAGGTAVMAAVVLGRAALSAHPDAWFYERRLVPPVGYTNGSAALWMLAFWPAVHLGATRAAPAWARPFFLAAASLLLDVAVLGQSRGWALVTPVVALLYLLLARQRLRALLGLAIVGAGTAVVLEPLVAVYTGGSAGRALGPALDHAAVLVVASCAAVAFAGGVWALVEQRVELSRRALVGIGVVLALLALGGAAVGAARAIDRVGHPGSWIRSSWRQFTCSTCEVSTSGTRFTAGVGGERYGEWRIAWREFLAHPAAGIGSDNYAAAYLRYRRDALIEPRYPHSTPLRLLSQLGVVGTALAALGLGAAVALALRRRRSLDPLAGGAVGAMLASFAYWLLHGSLDWFWEIPALAAPAFGLLGLAAGPVAEPGAERPPARRPGRPTATLVAAAGLVAAASFSLPWLSARYQKEAAAGWRADPAAAYRDLRVAAALDPVSPAPYVTEGTIAFARGEAPRARRAFLKALSREPSDWYARFQLGVLEGSLGRFAAARADIREARRLNPKDPVIALADRLAARHVRLRPETFRALYDATVRRRLKTNA